MGNQADRQKKLIKAMNTVRVFFNYDNTGLASKDRVPPKVMEHAGTGYEFRPLGPAYRYEKVPVITKLENGLKHTVIENRWVCHPSDPPNTKNWLDVPLGAWQAWNANAANQQKMMVDVKGADGETKRVTVLETELDMYQKKSVDAVKLDAEIAEKQKHLAFLESEQKRLEAEAATRRAAASS